MALGPLLTDGCGYTAEQSAAADRGEHEIDIGAVSEYFEPAGTLAGDDRRVVIGRDDGVAMLGGKRFGPFAAFRAGRSDIDDLRAQRSRRVSFDLRCVRRHDDDCGNAKGAGRIGDALSVIAAGVGDDAPPAFGLAQLRDGVVGATQFEAADGLQAFRFQIRYRVCDRCQPHQRRVQDCAVQALARLGKLRGGDQLSISNSCDH